MKALEESTVIQKNSTLNRRSSIPNNGSKERSRSPRARSSPPRSKKISREGKETGLEDIKPSVNEDIDVSMEEENFGKSFDYEDQEMNSEDEKTKKSKNEKKKEKEKNEIVARKRRGSAYLDANEKISPSKSKSGLKGRKKNTKSQKSSIPLEDFLELEKTIIISEKEYESSKTSSPKVEFPERTWSETTKEGSRVMVKGPGGEVKISLSSEIIKEKEQLEKFKKEREEVKRKRDQEKDKKSNCSRENFRY
eukprot:GHVP01053836.1.p2 GENE.GHVP01053836.1~~GHVP01053836.1.p2  ORF type:complete len:251 (-),score=85.79 GHVP01053836.1:1057-1809(-)